MFRIRWRHRPAERGGQARLWWAANRLDRVVAEMAAIRADRCMAGRGSRLAALELARDDLLLIAAGALDVDVTRTRAPLSVDRRRQLTDACRAAGATLVTEPSTPLRPVRS